MIQEAATLCALRSSARGIEVLMVRRSERARFVGGGYVFPGGALEDADRSPLAAELVEGADRELAPWLAAALREAFEEAGLLLSDQPIDAALRARLRSHHGLDFYEALAGVGLRLDASSLAHLSHWVAPPIVPRRFDTRFFVTEVPPGVRIAADGSEVTEALWVAPGEAILLAKEGRFPMIFPTLKHLELLASFSRPRDAVRHAKSQVVVPRVEPVVESGAEGTLWLRYPHGIGEEAPGR